MNTGRVGGSSEDARGNKVKIPHSSAVMKGIAEGNISWVRDPDFGYEVADGVPGFDDVELLQPRRLYARQGRVAEYEQIVRQLKQERLAELLKYPQLHPDIVKAAR